MNRPVGCAGLCAGRPAVSAGGMRAGLGFSLAQPTLRGCVEVGGALVLRHQMAHPSFAGSRFAPSPHAAAAGVNSASRRPNKAEAGSRGASVTRNLGNRNDDFIASLFSNLTVAKPTCRGRAPRPFIPDCGYSPSRKAGAAQGAPVPSSVGHLFRNTPERSGTAREAPSSTSIKGLSPPLVQSSHDARYDLADRLECVVAAAHATPRICAEPASPWQVIRVGSEQQAAALFAHEHERGARRNVGNRPSNFHREIGA